MTWSLNEIEALARKATRGAGYSWGLAEEAGKATRWTCAAGWPGATALADLLSRNDRTDPASLAPQSLLQPWTARSGCLCPLLTGASLCDLAANWANGTPLLIGPTAHPILLVPYMVWAADRTGAALSLRWQGVCVTRSAGETYLDGPITAPCPATVEQITLATASMPKGAPLQRTFRATPDPDAISILTALAHRTYAPDTVQSRLAGAGAGLTDND